MMETETQTQHTQKNVPEHQILQHIPLKWMCLTHPTTEWLGAEAQLELRCFNNHLQDLYTEFF